MMKRAFKPHGSTACAAHILSWQRDNNAISIQTVEGRQKLAFVCKDRVKELLSGERGKSDLCLTRDKFYLLTACKTDEATPKDGEDFLRVDLGVTDIVTDSTGEGHQGSHIKSVHYRQRRLRMQLQAKGTWSSSRHLHRLSGKERRFAADVNHPISKRIVVDTVVSSAPYTRRTVRFQDLPISTPFTGWIDSCRQKPL